MATLAFLRSELGRLICRAPPLANRRVPAIRTSAGAKVGAKVRRSCDDFRNLTGRVNSQPSTMGQKYNLNFFLLSRQIFAQYEGQRLQFWLV